MTPEEIDQVVMKVVKKIRKKPYGFLTEEDLAQEAWIILQAILPKWDKKRPLENFLMSSLVKRMKSFSRPYFRSKDRRKVTDFCELEDRPIFDKDSIEGDDLYQFIYNRLPQNMITDFHRLTEDEPIPMTRKAALLSQIKEILDED